MSCRQGSLIVDHKVQTNTESTAKVVTAANNLVNGLSKVKINNTLVSALSVNISTSGSNTGKIKSRMNVKSYIGKRYSERLV
jgi:hypothetical protein